jgi:RNA polymerase sigma-70 factor (ECF subfamily)
VDQRDEVGEDRESLSPPRVVPEVISNPAAVEAEGIEDQIAGFLPRLYGFGVSLTRDEHHAWDLAQETCVRALHAQASFTPGTNLKAWLFTILRNLYLNQRRNQRSRPQVISLEEALDERDEKVDIGASIAPTERAALARAELGEVVRALDTIPTAMAVPLRLVALEQLTYAEVARVLDIPIGTVMSRIHRARRMVLRRLSEQADD